MLSQTRPASGLLPLTAFAGRSSAAAASSAAHACAFTGRATLCFAATAALSKTTSTFSPGSTLFGLATSMRTINVSLAESATDDFSRTLPCSFAASPVVLATPDP